MFTLRVPNRVCLSFGTCYCYYYNFYFYFYFLVFGIPLCYHVCMNTHEHVFDDSVEAQSLLRATLNISEPVEVNTYKARQNQNIICSGLVFIYQKLRYKEFFSSIIFCKKSCIVSVPYLIDSIGPGMECVIKKTALHKWV